LAGALAAALLALAGDFLLGIVEQQFRFDRKARISSVQIVVLVVIALLLVFGLLSGLRRVQTPSITHANRAVIASKDFTESIILAEIAAQMLETRGVPVDRKFELGGNLPHEALLSGTADLYPEYTGTCYAAILHHQPISDPRKVYDQVKQEYATNFNLDISQPLGFENTFAILVRGDDARRLNLKTISDAAPFIPTWRAGLGQDFKSRADGFPGFSKSYGLKFAEVREMDLSLTYIALASKQVDLIAGNSTEGRIAQLDLFQLEDDHHYFPPYEAVYVVRKAAMSPELSDVLEKLTNAISTDEMRKLNYEVDGNKRDVKEVVRQWLAEHLVK
jgi:osmoprotectant transport system permease protein